MKKIFTYIIIFILGCFFGWFSFNRGYDFFSVPLKVTCIEGCQSYNRKILDEYKIELFVSYDGSFLRWEGLNIVKKQDIELMILMEHD